MYSSLEQQIPPPLTPLPSFEPDPLEITTPLPVDSYSRLSLAAPSNIRNISIYIILEIMNFILVFSIFFLHSLPAQPMLPAPIPMLELPVGLQALYPIDHLEAYPIEPIPSKFFL